jgi:alkanesulfonate monooxygenase SsuD/methylene tetrahydromethanopterin reductase-like flavin-dependent oxidoreductase (luciferase family)
VGIRVDEHAAASPSLLSGRPTELAERLAGFAALGFTGFNFQPADPDRHTQARRLAEEVIPLLRRMLD